MPVVAYHPSHLWVALVLWVAIVAFGFGLTVREVFRVLRSAR